MRDAAGGRVLPPAEGPLARTEGRSRGAVPIAAYAHLAPDDLDAIIADLRKG